MAKEVRRRGFSWKEFFRPNWFKIVISFIMFLTFPFIFFVSEYSRFIELFYIKLGNLTIIVASPILLLFMQFLSEGSRIISQPSIILSIFIEIMNRAYIQLITSALLSYVLSCIMLLKYKEYSKKSKFILILSIIIISLLFSFLMIKHYLAGYAPQSLG